jgi:hypothetical protein
MYHPPAHNVVIGGNTAGATSVVQSGVLTLVGGNNVTLSQAGNAITLSAGAGGGAANVFMFDNMKPGQFTALPTLYLSTNSLYLFPLAPGGGWGFPGNYSGGTVFIDVSGSVGAGTDGSGSGSGGGTGGGASFTLSAGIYVPITSGASSGGLTLVAQGTATAPADSSLINGNRFWTIPASQFTTTTSPPAGTATGITLAANQVYVAGMCMDQAFGAGSVSLVGANWFTTAGRSGVVGAAAPAATSTVGHVPWAGVWAGSLMGSLPAVVQSSDLDRTAQGANFVPHVQLNNLLGAF